MRKPLDHTRIYKEDKFKADKFIRELQNIQNANIKRPEFFRRVINSEDIKNLLRRDAEIKRIKRENERYG